MHSIFTVVMERSSEEKLAVVVSFFRVRPKKGKSTPGCMKYLKKEKSDYG